MTSRVFAATPTLFSYTSPERSTVANARLDTYLQLKENQADEDRRTDADQVNEQHGA
jgi:hypothetical protein